jgi:flagellar protein FlaG
MSFQIGPIQAAVLPAVTPRPAPAAPTADFAATLASATAPKGDVATISLPPSPPPEVQDEVAAARDRAAELAAQNRELHFSTDKDSGRIIVQVRDLEGNVIRTIPPSDALAVMSGAAI